jgi:hypothetical protein
MGLAVAEYDIEGVLLVWYTICFAIASLARSWSRTYLRRSITPQNTNPFSSLQQWKLAKALVIAFHHPRADPVSQ